MFSSSHVTAGERGGPVPRTISVSSWPRTPWPGAAAAFVRQTGFGTSRWSSLLQNAPQLMEWDTTVTTWPSKAPLNSPAALPCVTYGNKSRPTTATPSPYREPLICAVVKCFIYTSRAGPFILHYISSYRGLAINNKVVSRGLTSG